MPSWTRLSYIWNAPSTGTPPFVTGIWLLAPAGAASTDLEDIVIAAAAAYNTELHDLQSELIGTGVCTGVMTDETDVIEYTTPISAPGGGGGIRNPGFSCRAILQGARPPGARSNVMYWPYLDAAYYTAAGALNSTPASYLSNWADEILLACTGSPFQWRNRHFVDNDEHEASSSSVTGLSVAPSISFLRRRYR
jgi:hypothetical protein